MNNDELPAVVASRDIAATKMTTSGRALARGTAWMISFRLLDRLIGVLGTLVFARLLTPADFGLVAMATALIALVQIFGSFGLDMALIQRPGATREHYDTAWTLNIAIGGMVALVLVLSAAPLAAFYEDPRLVELVAVLALGPLIQGAQNIGIVAFRKELNFDREFRYLATKRILQFLVTVSLAFWLRNYWALVIGMVSGRVIGVVISYQLHPFRPRLSLAKANELLHFSGWLVATNFVSFLKERAPDFIVGKISGAAALGAWSVANQVSSLVGTELIAPMNRAAFPTFSKLAENREALTREYLSVAGLVALLVIPLVVGLAAVAPLFVTALLGSQWEAAGILVTLLAFNGLTNAFLGTTHAAVLAIGRPSVFVKIYVLQVCLLLPLLFVLTRAYGPLGAAVASVASAIGLLPINVAIVVRTLGAELRDLGVRVWRPLLAAGVMYAVVSGLLPPIDVSSVGSARAFGLLVTFTLLGAAVYLVAVSATWWLCRRPEGAEAVVLRQLRRMIAERLPQIRRRSS